MKAGRMILLVAVLLVMASCVLEPYNGRGVQEGGNLGCPRGYPDDYFPNRPDHPCGR